jgi:hypothetical protein
MIRLTTWRDGLDCEDYQQFFADKSQSDEMTQDFVVLNTAYVRNATSGGERTMVAMK